MIFDGGMRFDGTPADPALRLKFAGGRCFAKHQRNAAGHAYMDRFNGVAMFFPDVETYPKGGYLPGEDVPDGPVQAENKDSGPRQERIVDQPSGEIAQGTGSAGGGEAGSEPDQLSPEQPQPADEARRESGEGLRSDAEGVTEPSAPDPQLASGETSSQSIDISGSEPTSNTMPSEESTSPASTPMEESEPVPVDPTTADSAQSDTSIPTDPISAGSSPNSTTDAETVL